uniref:superoxide dismutase n=1 Tax=Scolopendra viridis TaxID=118503 RepID=A0A4D5R9W5_SCOVI
MALTAVCVLVGQLIGTIILTQDNPNAKLSVQGEIRNLTEGLHGFHIHEYGDVRNVCLAAGGHFNPFNKEHGAPTDDNRHVGDFGNINANADGLATINDQFDASLYGEHSVIGRAIVVHSQQDDLGKGGNAESKITGNAGKRLDCCVIGIGKTA